MAHRWRDTGLNTSPGCEGSNLLWNLGQCVPDTRNHTPRDSHVLTRQIENLKSHAGLNAFRGFHFQTFVKSLLVMAKMFNSCVHGSKINYRLIHCDVNTVESFKVRVPKLSDFRVWQFLQNLCF
jgi:hypothetical protein